LSLNTKGENVVKIQLVSLLVNDPIAAFKYYTETLGFVEKVYMPDMYLAIVASPEDPDGTTLLLEPNSSPIAEPFHKAVYEAGLPIIVFGTEDVQKEYERLKSKGVVFRSEPAQEGPVIAAIFEDTCGNLIQLAQYVG
jgi:catechol 2,3-dioxygenase-like lactoylglutathione lyase family enzyme